MINTLNHRRNTAASWTSTNPILAFGEVGLETDTGRFKFGDGSTAWNSLTYGSPVAANPTATIGLTAVNGSATTFMRSDDAPALSQAIAPNWTGVHTHTPSARSSGALPYYTINAPADTGITASTEAIGVRFVGATRTRAAGAVTTQREIVIGAPTYAAASATTITTAATVAIAAAPTAGSNVTISNPYALWVQSGTSYFAGPIIGQNPANTETFTLRHNGLTELLSNSGSLKLRANNNVDIFVTDSHCIASFYGGGSFNNRASLGRDTYLSWNDNYLSNSSQLSWDVALVRSAPRVLQICGANVSIPGGISSAANTPATITADQNNYSPGAGWFQRWSSDATRTVTGMVAGSAGETRNIWNVGSQNIVLTHQDAASTAANRWLSSTGANLTLSADKCALCVYDATTQRWRVTLLP